MILKHEFVEFVPEELEEETLYISVEYGTAVHKCCCGCGNEVVTPFSPTDWKLSYDGESVSLSPSIGNWNFPCKSHYWIRGNHVEWSGKWSNKLIKENREQDKKVKEEFYNEKAKTTVKEPEPKRKKRWWLLEFLFGR